ncbi:MAG: UDP-N-acetylmuramoyl-L-alanyl-D-glutamate--2,6-diaminopimelate ligase [Patescibacteria group bacterium]
MKALIKKFIPQSLLNWYHLALAHIGAELYGFPSRQMIIIGVTGTKGKSTTAYLIAKVLESAGYKVGLTTTVLFKIAEREWSNDLKQTMPGRFKLQKMLRQMVKAGCQYAVIETSSEGISQHRHVGIDYDIAVFTNLSPEHIESHGSFENYRAAKLSLFKELAHGYRKVIDGHLVKKIVVANSDDSEGSKFLATAADGQWAYGLHVDTPALSDDVEVVFSEQVKVSETGSEFAVNHVLFRLPLLGKFNIYNALAAIAVGMSQHIELGHIKVALEKVTGLPGRMEEIKNDKGFRVFVDYAHEPASLEAVYQTLKTFQPKKIISVLGSQGGGRDKAKRPILGRLAAEYTDHIIVTNEDPYNEDPQAIINEVADGVLQMARGKVEKILDRKQALKRAIELAQPGDIVIVTGKGGETKMALKNGKLVDWSDAVILKELLQ